MSKPLTKSNWPTEELRQKAIFAVHEAEEITYGTMPPVDRLEYGWNYGEMSGVEFYAELLGAVAKFESNFNNDVKYEESFSDSTGRPVISRGLLQLSFESSNQSAYGPKIRTPEDLHNPDVNLGKAARILLYWIAKDGMIAGGKTGHWSGAARYWSQFRKTSRVAEIQQMMKDVLNEQPENDMEDKILKTIPKYGDHGTGDVEKLQRAIGVDDDDWFGDETKRELIKLQKANGLKGTGVIPADGGRTFQILGLTYKPLTEADMPKPVFSANYFGAPWVGVRVDLLGRSESDKDLNDWLVPEWKQEGLNYKTLVGNTHAWCSVNVNKKLRDVKVKGTNSAAAASHSTWGRKCPFWFGATLPIKHKSGGRHVCFFLYWIDESKKLCATMDGNRSNKYAINVTDLSGKGDTLVGGPRWSKDVADGQIVSMAEVLKKYPHLKVGSKGTGGSTR